MCWLAKGVENPTRARVVDGFATVPLVVFLTLAKGECVRLKRVGVCPLTRASGRDG